MSSNRELTPRAREMYALVEKYLNCDSDLSQRAFCQSEGVSYSTFGWWSRQYRKFKAKVVLPTEEKVPAQDSSREDFIPLEIVDKPIDLWVGGGCEIKYPNGVVLILSGEVNINLLERLLILKENR